MRNTRYLTVSLLLIVVGVVFGFLGWMSLNVVSLTLQGPSPPAEDILPQAAHFLHVGRLYLTLGCVFLLAGGLELGLSLRRKGPE